VPYLSSEAVGLSFMRFPLAIILVTLASTAQAQSREQNPVDWRTFEIPDFARPMECWCAMRQTCRWNLGTTYRRRALFVCEGSPASPRSPDRAPS
jgi:hypothetical protein